MAKGEKKTPDESALSGIPSITKGTKKVVEKLNTKLVPRNYRFPAHLDDQINRQAYWERENKTEVLMKILVDYYKEHPQEPIPDKD